MMNIQNLRKEINPYFYHRKFFGLFYSLTVLSFFTLSISLYFLIPQYSIIFAIMAALFYTTMVSMMHDGVHGSLTGIGWYDTTYGTIVCSLVFFSFQYYKHIHILHHKLNGHSLDDPERYQLTKEEIDNSHPIIHKIIKRGVFFESILYGAIGLLGKMYSKFPTYKKKYPLLAKRVYRDIVIFLFINTIFFSVSFYYDVVFEHIILLLIIERITGAIHQYVSRMAHNDQWFKDCNHFEQQIRNTRTVKANFFGSYLLNNLNLHTAHHAFPNIPFYHLPKVSKILHRYIKENPDQFPEEDLRDNYFHLFRSQKEVFSISNPT